MPFAALPSLLYICLHLCLSLSLCLSVCLSVSPPIESVPVSLSISFWMSSMNVLGCLCVSSLPPPGGTKRPSAGKAPPQSGEAPGLGVAPCAASATPAAAAAAAAAAGAATAACAQGAAAAPPSVVGLPSPPPCSVWSHYHLEMPAAVSPQGTHQEREGDPNRSCTLCGTSEYMPPETLLRKGQHFCSDAWAFGILLHELVFWSVSLSLSLSPFDVAPLYGPTCLLAAGAGEGETGTSSSRERGNRTHKKLHERQQMTRQRETARDPRRYKNK